MNTCPLTETYHEVEKEIYKVCWKFHRRYSWTDFEELVGIANYEFVNRTYDEYDPDRSKFSTWVWNTVWNALLNSLEEQRIRYVETAELESTPAEQRFNLRSFLLELSDDAQVLTRVVVEAPPELITKIQNEGLEVLDRKMLGFGWTLDRISKAFNEIREALR